MVAPGHKAGQRTIQPAQLLDIFPTLLDLAGLPADAKQEGNSLLPLIKDVSSPWPNVALTSFGKGNYGIRSQYHRYIRYHDGSEELYDHREDPHEWNNLAASKDHEAILADHRRHLPKKEEEILPGRSTGHKAYQAAGKLIK